MKIGTSEYRIAHLNVEKVRGKPNYCESCENTDKDVVYHWANVSGKYDDANDYKRLCCTCHSAFDDRQGSKHYKAKLNEDDVREIKHLIKSKALPIFKIAEKYNVHKNTISSISIGWSWKHIKI